MQSPAYDKEWPPHLESLDQQYELDLPEFDGDDEAVLLQHLSSTLRKRIEKDRAHEMQAIKEKPWVLALIQAHVVYSSWCQSISRFGTGWTARSDIKRRWVQCVYRQPGSQESNHQTPP
jgi:hypothetical protein